MRRLMSSLLGDRSGATSLEYALIACGISLAIMVAVQGIGPTVNGKLDSVSITMK